MGSGDDMFRIWSGPGGSSHKEPLPGTRSHRAHGRIFMRNRMGYLRIAWTLGRPLRSRYVSGQLVAYDGGTTSFRRPSRLAPHAGGLCDQL